MQKALEEKNISVVSSLLEWIPTSTVELPEDQAEEVLKLVGRLEQDEDVQRVFHNLV
jgi:transcriptional/translational regulatory protein YebC/TACO1